MTNQHNQEIMNAATFALRCLTGYPEFAPTAHTIIFASGGERDFDGANWICGIVQESGNDLIHVNFADPIAEGPVSVSLALRQTLSVDWHPHVQLYAASEQAPIELLTQDQRWAVGPRHILTAKPLPPRSKIKAGVERAARRWREARQAMADGELPVSHFVSIGASYADAMPEQADASIVRMFG